MSKVTIYHNPRCSKSRQALEIIESCGYQAQVVAYLEEPPSPATLDALLAAMGLEPLEVIRTKERRFGELGLSTRDKRERSQWLRIISENPILLERPIVVFEGKVVLGRPPAKILEIIS